MSNDYVKKWFSSRKLGLFLHFGLYSIEGWHEQDQMRRRIPRAEYSKLIELFNPVDFSADEILDFAESVGMEYICLTTKHHDGFCLWNTKETDFNIMNAPYGKDIIAKFAEACHARNFPLGLYYSVVDWHQPNYPNQGRHHEIEGPEEGDNPDWDKYMEFLKAQVRELCTNYGKVSHWFWDMNVPEYVDPSVNQMIRELQPEIVINNRGFDDGDFGTPEREYHHDLGEAESGFCRPTEACNSVGTQSWGFRFDEDYYSTAFLIKSIDEMMCKEAHYLLNIGPDANGKIPKTATDILSEIGVWYQKVREAFGNTEPCTEISKNPDLMLTRRGNTIYVHVPPPIKADAVMLRPISTLPKNATLLNTGEQLDVSNDVLPVHWKNENRILRIKGIPRGLLSTNEVLVIKLKFDCDPAIENSEVSKFKG